ncbi:titin isoform X2 [Drosophila eugracilis]|uniref:titin isoform X2 n=1 Tax=Drosophila eugracilis TaxID=29029 RepID=UPI0007E89FB1|nr:titin isoform X2 [Drosophila eugracilis]
MDDSRRQVVMGPPAAVTPTIHPIPGNPNIASPSQNTKSAAPPKRIIKKVQLDFNKLKEAGLDRQLAEVLRKQKFAAKKVETPSSSNVTPPATAQPTSTAAESKLQPSQQQLHQPAPTLVKRFMISEFIEKTVPVQMTPNPSDVDRSKQVKALLKNRILNKNMVLSPHTSPQQKPTTSKATPIMPGPSAQGSACLNPGIATTPAAFSIPIAKADVTVRSKQPPLLLNLVNQLPRHRATCRSNSKPLVNQPETTEQHSAQYSVQQVSQSPQRIPVQQSPPISTTLSPQHLPQPSPEVPKVQEASAIPITLLTSPSPPLIVLENKVLAPEEKIDLSRLRLPNSSVTTALTQVKPLEIPIQSNLQSKVNKGKVIINANKLKVSRDKLAEMAKEIRTQADLTSKDLNQTIEMPFTINSILQRNKTPLFPTAEPVDNPNLTNDLPACTGLSIQSNQIETVQPKVSPKTDFLEFIPTTTELKDIPAEVPQTSSENNIDTPERKPYSEEVSKAPKNQEYSPSTSEVEELNTVANPLDFPVYIPSTSEQLSAAPNTKSSPIKPSTEVISYPEENPELNTSVYIPLTSEKEIPEKVLSKSNVEPENMNDKVETAPSFLEVPVCVPSTCETSLSLTPKLDVTSPEENIQTNLPADTSSVPKIQSAVDFIAQLTAENPLDESSFMDLSPEEQRLSALFGGGDFSFSDVSPVKETLQPEEELPIGKIVKLDDMNILHATLDVNSDSTNVLRISPNAMLMQGSMARLDTPLMEIDDVSDSVMEDSNVSINLPEPLEKVASETENVKSLLTETPPQEAKEEKPSLEASTNLTEEPLKSKEPEVPSKEIKPVSEPEPVKEVNPPVKRVPMRSKKAKINLVQRNKRPNIQKPIEVKKTKLDFEEDEEQTMMGIDHSLAEDRYAGTEVPVDEKQCDEEVSEARVEDPVQESIPRIEDEGGVQNIKEEPQIPTKSSTERDLTQLYHPPKMPKNLSSKQSSSQETLEDPPPTTSKNSISLVEILSQDPPKPQGEAQVPFRKESIELNSNTHISTGAKGIQNLIVHLTAEIQKPSSMPKSEEPPKPMPRKKLVKTRPVLSKRSSKVAQRKSPEMPNHFEFLHPVSANVGGRIPTSSTSDDDSSIFLGFDNKEEKRSKTPVRSKRLKQMKINETDISDDATPDYDETEEEQPSAEIEPLEKNSDVTTLKKHTVLGSFSDDSNISNGGPASPMDFGDSVTMDENTPCEGFPKVETISWEQLVNEKPSDGLDNKEESDTKVEEGHASESTNEAVKPAEDISRKEDPPNTDSDAECSGNKSKIHNEEPLVDVCNKNEDKTPVINEKDLFVDVKTRKGRRKSQKSNTISITETPDQPSTSKDSITIIGINEQKDRIEEVDASDNENPKNRDLVQSEEKPLEDTVKTANTAGKRKSRPGSKHNSELEAAKVPEQTSSNKRKTRSNSPKLKVPLITEPDQKTENTNEAESALNQMKTRKSRYSKAKSVSITPAASEKERITDPGKSTVSQDLEEEKATVDVNTKVSQKSCSKSPNKAETPKVVVSKETLSNTDGQEKLEEVQAAEEPIQDKKQEKSKNKRKSRSSTLNVKHKELTEPAPEPNLNPEKSISDVSQETVPDSEDSNVPTSTRKSRGKRQSRYEPKSNSVATVDTQAVTDLIPPEEPQQVDTPIDSSASSVITTEKETILVSAPKRGRRSKVNSAPVETETSTPTSESIPTESEEPKVPAKRGRKRAAPPDTESESAKKAKTEESLEPVTIAEFNLRLLLIRKRDELETDEDVTDDGKGEGPLQCGLCLARSDKKNWQRHLGEHYGVGWLVGETPKKITRSWVITMIKTYLQNNSGKLACRLCNHQLGSALGMMLHLEGCGNKQRLLCDFCQRSYTKLSLPVHIRTCPKRQMYQMEETVEEDANETVLSNAGRAKRKSTIKAETKLRKIGEELTLQKGGEKTSTKNDFDGDSSDYDMAKDKESSEEYESEGADSNEESFSSEDEASLTEGSSPTKKSKTNKRGDVGRKRKLKQPQNMSERQPLLSRYHHLEARATHRWNEFVQLNYGTGSLFTQLLPSFTKISSKEATSLLPSKDAASVRYAYGKVQSDNDWKQMAPMEGFKKEGEYVSYLGSSINKLAWLPLPPKVADQYLLCSLRSRMKSFARHTKLKDEDALLMLLKCTVPESQNITKTWAPRPEFHYGIRVPHGPIHNFCFLPSSGYDKSTNRLGLLAVANSLSDVHIYALPLELTKEEGSADVVIELESLITLCLDINNPVEEQCTQICWSQSSGHNFLATGYSNGYIAFWDIDDKDNFNSFRRNNQTYFVPLHYFYIGERNVQYMDLHYDNNGPRWLAVGTSIRQFKVYDIKDWSSPRILTQDTICNLYMANLTWSPICEALVVSSSHFSRTIAVSPSGIQFEHRTLDGTLTTTRDMHTNCQQNHMVFVTDNGDLIFLDVRDLNCGPVLLKSTVNTRAVSTTELHHLGKTTPKITELISEDEFIQDYGVQIKPVAPEPHRSKSTYLDAKRRPKNLHSLALTRFNCVRCNWNSPAHTWVAMGAEHGLLRILNFDRDKFF